LLEAEELQWRGHSARIAGRARISVGGTAGLPVLLAEDRVSVWTALRAPRSYANPGSPDAVERARREGIQALGHCKSGLLVRRLAAGGGSVPAVAARLRGWARAMLAAHLPPGAEQAVVRAMLLGDRNSLDPGIEESFRIAGTYHVLSLSGA